MPHKHHAMLQVIPGDTIQDEREYYAVQAALSRPDRPHFILRSLMRLFESYRAARKMGWSRPWNKYGVVNFQSFQLDVSTDTALLDLAWTILQVECPAMPASAGAFAKTLLEERTQLKGFLFFQEATIDGQRFEGANLSLGRRAAGQPRYRDRLDIILESPIVHAESQGLARLRVFVDPYTSQREPLWSMVSERLHSQAPAALFALLARMSWEQAENPQRLWNHWTSAYIDYFGPRPEGIRKSYFYVPHTPTARLFPVAEEAGNHTAARTLEVATR